VAAGDDFAGKPGDLAAIDLPEVVARGLANTLYPVGQGPVYRVAECGTARRLPLGRDRCGQGPWLSQLVLLLLQPSLGCRFSIEGLGLAEYPDSCLLHSDLGTPLCAAAPLRFDRRD
jgi:hypothetical protein